MRLLAIHPVCWCYGDVMCALLYILGNLIESGQSSAHEWMADHAPFLLEMLASGFCRSQTFSNQREPFLLENPVSGFC